MKNLRTGLFTGIAALLLITGCESKDAVDAANSSGSFSATDINGTWKESKTNMTVRISGTTSTSNGTGVLTAAGTAYPSSAVGGTLMTGISRQSGGYFEANDYTYTTSGTWVAHTRIGLAMDDSKKQFKIGSAVYVRQ